jgi:sec-independent protein translocase protein TatA
MELGLIPVLNTVGPTELIIVLAIILLLFGAKRIPELARGLGTGIREFKRGTRGEGEEELREEKRGEELTAGAGRDEASARTQEEAARAERSTEQKR